MIVKYFTGIDAHNRTCMFQHMDADGALGLSMNLPTDKDGFERFFSQLDAQTVITLEAGRNYWWLYQYLSSHPKVSEVKVVDPRRSRNIAQGLSVKNGYGRAKTDRIDSEMLAEQTRLGMAPTIHVPTDEQLFSRSLCRHRFMLISQRTRTKNTLHAHASMHGITANITALLKEADVRADFVKSLPQAIGFIIEQLLAQIRLYDAQISCCDAELDKLLPVSCPQMKLLLTTPGIGPVLGRIILTEIGDIANFKAPKYLISYGGLAPVANESGGRKGPIRLNRQSNYYLKYAFIEAAHNAWDYPAYRKKYEQDAKKHGKIIAKINLARRIAKSVFWMLTRQQPYDK